MTLDLSILYAATGTAKLADLPAYGTRLRELVPHALLRHVALLLVSWICRHVCGRPGFRNAAPFRLINKA